jgi:hypothetical protein
VQPRAPLSQAKGSARRWSASSVIVRHAARRAAIDKSEIAAGIALDQGPSDYFGRHPISDLRMLEIDLRRYAQQ